MRFRSFIITYGLVLAILLFADRRPHPSLQDRYAHVVDLTDGEDEHASAAEQKAEIPAASRTRIVAPDALIPGTWTAGQIPAERLVAPLVVMDVSDKTGRPSPVSLDSIAAWEAEHGAVPQGAIIAIRRNMTADALSKPEAANEMPITAEAARFLMDARYSVGFVFGSAADLSDRTLTRQVALHGNYVVEGAARLSALPPTGSLMIVAPAKKPARKNGSGRVPVRVLAMVR